MEADKELSLAPPEIVTTPGVKYRKEGRQWQGIPGIERTPGGRLWAALYSGGDTEGPDNYVVLITSGDDGDTWSHPVLAVDPPGPVRAFDPCLWLDPAGRLWLFWAQSYEFYDGRAGVWAMFSGNADEAAPEWSQPRRIADGVMMNKPTVLSSGEWLLPYAVWGFRDKETGEQISSAHNHFPAEMYANVLCSTDQGKTFQRIGYVDMPERSYDEHMLTELKNGDLWMLVRTYGGIGESFSTDKGITWSKPQADVLEGPCSRFFIRRLNSGNLLLVNHHNFEGRNNLSAMLSRDDGETWEGFLLLDERENVSYPDGVQAEDGRIYIIYDRERYKDKEILLAVFEEADVLAGRVITDRARLKVLVQEGTADPCPEE
ncbi:exo-alpha-sialidase [Paenibacillus sp. LMG 31459]|uniref:Exo-alpha-sialidase n=1 Tax=Paenibacillus phytohabitans TaxID=2654978 RepID=A0ABX1YRJ1_9BACL|nr:sialidase family protein [Paenibacillus phytohabitans]NOU82914.1 exo-alpha-sialidase [Paenibacillus phytohabitans]